MLRVKAEVCKVLFIFYIFIVFLLFVIFYWQEYIVDVYRNSLIPYVSFNICLIDVRFIWILLVFANGPTFCLNIVRLGYNFKEKKNKKIRNKKIRNKKKLREILHNEKISIMSYK